MKYIILLCVIFCANVLTLETEGGGDNLGTVVLVSPVLAASRSQRSKDKALAKDFPTLRVLSPNDAAEDDAKNTEHDVNDTNAKTEDTKATKTDASPSPIYVKKLSSQSDVKHVKRRRRVRSTTTSPAPPAVQNRH